MRHPGSVTEIVRRMGPGGAVEVADHVAVEEPLEIRLDGWRVATTMRTPGHDRELAVGFCFTDGLIGDAEVLDVRHCAGEHTRAGGAEGGEGDEHNVVVVDTGCLAPEPVARLGTTTSSCGWCGSAQIDDLAGRLEPLAAPVPFAPELLASIPEVARSGQALFSRTGGVHAAAAFDRSGDIRVVREDIGRHNAVDKVVGHLVLSGAVPAGDLGLFVSGRASFELVQKAWAAGFSALVAVSAPSSLAVATARRARLALAGFARPGRLNVYVDPHGERQGDPAAGRGCDGSPNITGLAAGPAPATDVALDADVRASEHV